MVLVFQTTEPSDDEQIVRQPSNQQRSHKACHQIIAAPCEVKTYILSYQCSRRRFDPHFSGLEDRASNSGGRPPHWITIIVVSVGLTWFVDAVATLVPPPAGPISSSTWPAIIIVVSIYYPYFSDYHPHSRYNRPPTAWSLYFHSRRGSANIAPRMFQWSLSAWRAPGRVCLPSARRADPTPSSNRSPKCQIRICMWPNLGWTTVYSGHDFEQWTRNRYNRLCDLDRCVWEGVCSVPHKISTETEHHNIEKEITETQWPTGRP